MYVYLYSIYRSSNTKKKKQNRKEKRTLCNLTYYRRWRIAEIVLNNRWICHQRPEQMSSSRVWVTMATSAHDVVSLRLKKKPKAKIQSLDCLQFQLKCMWLTNQQTKGAKCIDTNACRCCIQWYQTIIHQLSGIVETNLVDGAPMVFWCFVIHLTLHLIHCIIEQHLANLAFLYWCQAEQEQHKMRCNLPINWRQSLICMMLEHHQVLDVTSIWPNKITKYSLTVSAIAIDKTNTRWLTHKIFLYSRNCDIRCGNCNIVPLPLCEYDFLYASTLFIWFACCSLFAKSKQKSVPRWPQKNIEMKMHFCTRTHTRSQHQKHTRTRSMGFTCSCMRWHCCMNDKISLGFWVHGTYRGRFIGWIYALLRGWGWWSSSILCNYNETKPIRRTGGMCSVERSDCRIHWEYIILLLIVVVYTKRAIVRSAIVVCRSLVDRFHWQLEFCGMVFVCGEREANMHDVCNMMDGEQ